MLNKLQNALKSQSGNRKLLDFPKLAPNPLSVDIHDKYLDGLFDSDLDLLDFASNPNQPPDKSNNTLNTSIPILRAYVPSPFVTFNDFQKILPDVPLKGVIKGRYGNNFIHNNDYFILFDSLQHLNEYYNFCAKGNITIDGGTYLSLTDTNDIVSSIRFMFSTITMDLVDLPTILKFCTHDIDSLMRFIKSKQNALHRVRPQQPHIKNINKLLLSKGVSNIDNLNLGPLTPRNHCVVFSNVYDKIDKEKIKNFYWDLSLSDIRPVFKDKNSHMITYLFVFPDSESARRCVLRSHNKHLFFDSDNAIVSAELL